MNDQPREGFIIGQPQRPAQPEPQPRPNGPAQQAMPMPEPVLEQPPIERDATVMPQEHWPIVVKLMYKPIKDERNNTLTELSFREPRGGDINRYGNPCRINQEGDVVIDERKMHYIMSALCGVLPPMLEMLDPRDWNSCAYRLRNFFLPDLRSW
jgi:hypothetical protein